MEDQSPFHDLSDAIQEVSTIIDPTDPEQTALFTDLQSNQNSPEALKKLDHLLVLIITRTKSKPANLNVNSSNLIIQDLSSHLQSTIQFLQSLSRNADLASLFLVGENSYPSFSSVQKSILQEQASRSQHFRLKHYY